MPGVEPPVRLGRLAPGGLAPALLAVVERGMRTRPEAASGLKGEVELSADGHPPVRIRFGPDGPAVVEDGPSEDPDARVEGPLGDIVGLLTTPLLAGLPNPMHARGRAALGTLAGGRVRVEGSLGLVRRFLRLVRIEAAS